VSAVDPVTGALHMSDDEWDHLVQCFNRISASTTEAISILADEAERNQPAPGQIGAGQ